MEPSSSLFRLSPGSSCSSTLIMTPAPLPSLRGPAPKGALQPHITNLPRRRRAPIATSLRISAPPTPSRSTASPAPGSAQPTTPIHLPALPPLPFPISAGGVPDRPSAPAPTARGNVQPAHGNVPRRAKPMTEAQMRARRRRERCVQELGRASGIFVAFPCDSAEDENEFGAEVRIAPGPDEGATDVDVDDKGGGAAILRVVAPGTRDDGVPCLEPAQLRAAGAFVSKQRTAGRRVVITAPRAHAVDALSVGVCCVAASELPSHEPPGQDPKVLDDADPELHRLVMRWHDLPADDDDDDYGGGLKGEWRGLLSRDGMDYLATAVGVPIPASTPPWP
ncbi:hypothetical protein DFH07DRAFT_798780 [Mycena maculata]|uniref:Uncharacterized protein n=1 Tax=Mycena maculata TaxID=230809 RepID=A0AAD7K1W5_9AGAR|nr:hypothetical protein DFH07DRAFT_798780 [Mycena maculata]